jgi:hypothetical protein
MKLFKISTIALAMALTVWVACGSSTHNNSDVQTLPGTGGAVAMDGPSGSGGSGGAPDGGSPDATADAPIPADVPADGAAVPIDTSGPGICNGLSEAACHLVIVNAPTDPSVAALDPGPNPPIPYPNCAAQ